MDVYAETKRFYKRYAGEKKIIGKSVFGRNLYALKFGSGFPIGIAQYAIHGREYIVTRLSFLQLRRGGIVGTLWIIPLSNPDGALLSERGIHSVPKEERSRLLRLNGSSDFRLWKANGRGVDLNVNFPAKWGKGKKNVFSPSSQNYVGPFPLSEPETLALQTFTEEIKPDYTLSYHTKGEEIYDRFYQSGKNRKRDLKIALAVAESTGYLIKNGYGSVGGYKDWCIEKFSIPSLTIEAGKDEWEHPLGKRYLKKLLVANQNVLSVMSAAVKKSFE